jgi:signal transduction histidine kinase
VHALFAPDEVAKVEPFFRKVFRGATVTFDLPLVQRIYEVHASPLPVTDRPLILVVVQDATAVRTEQRTHRSKNAFVSAVAHELRQPLAPLRTAVGTLKRGPAPADTARLFQIIERQVAHLTRLVNDLSDSAQLAAGRLELSLGDVDLCSVITEVIESARSVARGRRLVWNAPAPLIVRVLANIIFNAIRHTDEDGAIVVTLRPEADAVVLSVADDGDGIPAALLPHVFELFIQGDRRHGRMGVGLHLARGIIAEHGGTIEVSSEGEGQGTQFTIRLPREPLAGSVSETGS